MFKDTGVKSSQSSCTCAISTSPLVRINFVLSKQIKFCGPLEIHYLPHVCIYNIPYHNVPPTLSLASNFINNAP